MSDAHLNKYENASKTNIANKTEPKSEIYLGHSTNKYHTKNQTINYNEARQEVKASDVPNLLRPASEKVTSFDKNMPLMGREVDSYKTLVAYAASQKNTQQKGNSNPLKYLVQTKASSADPHEASTPRGIFLIFACLSSLQSIIIIISVKLGKAAALLGTEPITRSHKQDIHHADYTSNQQHSNNNASNKQTTSRRNSDPSSNKVPLLEVNRGNDMYQSSTHINIAGHRFHKATRIGKGEKCASCQENDAFINEGHRCLDCKLLVHTKCIQNGGVKGLHCEAKRSKRQTRKNLDKVLTKNSKYSGTREYTDSTDKIISDAKELQLMQDFITQKIYKMDSEKSSEIDRVFKQALREFKDNLVAQYSIAHKHKSDSLNIKYRDLITNFEQVMQTCCGNRKDDFPLTMGVNAFRGFMNEFMNSRDTDKPKAKRKKEKKRKIDDYTNYNGLYFFFTVQSLET